MHTVSKAVHLSHQELRALLARWQDAWNRHDLEAVMSLFHDDVLFENWTGQRVQGKRLLRRAWTPWFANPGGFRFIDEEILVDEVEQKAVYRWRLEWPSQEAGHLGRRETRHGLDVLHFHDGRIVQKLTYSKTTVTIEGDRVPLVACPESPATNG